jgi:hypothetical protein
MLASSLLSESKRGKLVRRCDVSMASHSVMPNLLSIGTTREAEQVPVPHEVGEQLETGCQCCSAVVNICARMEDGLS